MRRVLLLVAAGLVFLASASWVAAHREYASWHPCDWLLQARVDRVLRQRGIDPDTASIPMKAAVVGSPEVQAVLRLRATAPQCLGTWAVSRIFFL